MSVCITSAWQMNDAPTTYSLLQHKGELKEGLLVVGGGAGVPILHLFITADHAARRGLSLYFKRLLSQEGFGSIFSPLLKRTPHLRLLFHLGME